MHALPDPPERFDDRQPDTTAADDSTAEDAQVDEGDDAEVDETPEPPNDAVVLGTTAANQSVEALIGDVVHIFRNIRPGSQWPKIAAQVLEHHSPPVDERPLDEWHRDLQRCGRDVLDALISADITRIEDAIVRLRLLQGAPDLLRQHDRVAPEIVLD